LNFHSCYRRINYKSSTAGRYPGISAKNYSGSVGGFPAFNVTYYRGSYGALELLQAGDTIGVFNGQAATNSSGSEVNTAQIQFVASANHTSTSTSSAMHFYTTPLGEINMQRRMTITDNGNVGIGTTSPSAKLDVGGNIAINGTLYNPAVANDGFVGIASDSAAGTATSGVRAWGRSNLSYPGDLHLISRDTGAIRFYNYNGSTWNEQARVSSTGNVGIGTSSPNQSLHTTASAQFGGRAYVTGDTGNAMNVPSLVMRYDTTNNYGEIFARDYSTASQRNLILQSSVGNVGIGTTNPGAKLEVNGTIKVNGRIANYTSSCATGNVYATTSYDASGMPSETYAALRDGTARLAIKAYQSAGCTGYYYTIYPQSQVRDSPWVVYWVLSTLPEQNPTASYLVVVTY
jgi:hypothetical protein